MTDLVAALTLKLNDQGSAPAARALQTVTKALKEAEFAATSMSGRSISAFQKLASAREVLGIRAEKAVQNEIRLTEAAYQRLAQSGELSVRELGRAQDAMRQKVAALRQELDGVRHSAGGAGSAIARATALVGAYQAGKAVLSGPIGQTMGYDRQLANLSNTAYAGQSLNARRAGMHTLDAAINAAVRTGGGTREGALGTLDRLVASGAFSDVGEAASLLPMLTKAGTAANADPAQLAEIAIRAKQTFGLKNTGLALDQAIRAGQLGGFELKDMAKWLPQQMAMARQSGLVGESGFRTLLAANQAVAITAGSKDEAGNNLVNLLAKINSQDTSRDAARLGIDLSGSLAAARGKGVNALDAFVNLTDRIVGSDKRYQALRTQASSATGGERKAALEGMGDILQGSAIGKLVQDRQALMALVGIMNNRGYMRGIYDQTGNAGGAAADAFSLIADTPSFKAEQLAAEKAIAMQQALDKVNPALGGVAEGLSGLMREFPLLSAAVVGSTLAVTALAASAGTAAAALALLGGKAPGLPLPGGPNMPSVPGAPAAGGGVGAWMARAAAGGTGWMSQLSLAAAPIALMGMATLWAKDTSHDQERIGWRRSLGDSLTSLMGDPTAASKARYEAMRADLNPAPQRVEVTVDVRNGNIVAEVKKDIERQAQRH